MIMFVLSCAFKTNFQTTCSSTGVVLTLFHGWLFLGGSGPVWKQCQGHRGRWKRNWAERGRPQQKQPPTEDKRRTQSQTQLSQWQIGNKGQQKSFVPLALSRASFVIYFLKTVLMITDVCSSFPLMSFKRMSFIFMQILIRRKNKSIWSCFLLKSFLKRPRWLQTIE